MAGVIDMSGDANISPTAAGYIGIDLRDDHPVAIKHNAGSGPGQDPELKNPITGKVRLYGLDAQSRAVATKNNGDYVECTSCHDAHDNQYGKFLIDSNLGSNVCTSCHRKETGAVAGIGTLAHDNATSVNYNPDNSSPARIGEQVGQVKCMNCHYTHRAGATGAALPFTANADYGPYLLSFQKEGTCFNLPNRWGQSINVCHAAGAATDIESQENKPSSHKYISGIFETKHKATEQGTGSAKYGTLATNWHVECSDCHNPHTAGSMSHNIGVNTVEDTSPLYGAGGVRVLTYPLGNWPLLTQSDYDAFESLGVTDSTSMPVADYYEYQICFKCHSSFAWGDNPSSAPNSPTLGAPMTNQAKEFNPQNYSFHPVAGENLSNEGAAGYIGGWSSGNQKMYCSDCHADNMGISKGPHGSSATLGSGLAAAILKAGFTDTYSSNKNDTQPMNDICFQCHSETLYQSGLATQAGTGFYTTGNTNLHTQHKIKASTFGSSTFGYRCVNCHTRIPHGYKNKALIVTGADGADVATYAAGSAAKISSWSSPNSGQYKPLKTDNDCTTANGCHGP
jgi:predicted CXXCH cytochrome family protein